MIINRAYEEQGVGDESERLFQIKQKSKELFVFKIPQKELISIELDFEVPTQPGFCNINN